MKAYLIEIASKGGKARAARNSKAKLSKWGKMGGRPRKYPKLTKRANRTKQSA